MRRTFFGMMVMFCCSFTARPAHALDVSLNAGVFQEVSLPDGGDGGLYPNVGIGLAFPAGPVSLWPWVGVEKSDLGNWGFAAMLTADYQVAEHVGLDANIAFQHDQSGGNFADAGYYLGAGIGISYYTGHWTFSSYANIYPGLNVDYTYFVPGVNIGYTL